MNTLETFSSEKDWWHVPLIEGGLYEWKIVHPYQMNIVITRFRVTSITNLTDLWHITTSMKIREIEIFTLVILLGFISMNYDDQMDTLLHYGLTPVNMSPFSDVIFSDELNLS